MMSVIVFEKDVGSLWRNGKSRFCIRVDWTCSPRNARSGGNITLQGNFDPSRLLFQFGDKKMVHEMIDEFGKDTS
jgi:uroporphyrinogen decarboxylase